MDALSDFRSDLCADASSGSSLNKVELVSSNSLPDPPGKRVTVVRVTYGPGGFTPRTVMPVRSRRTSPKAKSGRNSKAARWRSRRRSVFRRTPGAIHLVSANASNTDWAELIAVFVADEAHN